MNLSQSSIDALALTWMRLHRSAAQPHLERMIRQIQDSGDTHGAAAYSRILDAVWAKQSGRGQDSEQASPAYS